MPDIFIAPKEEEKVVHIDHDLKPRKLWPHPRGGSLSAFASYPKNIRFQTQEENEKIIFLLRRHIVTNFPWVFIAVIMLIFPFFSPWIYPHLPFSIPLNFQVVGFIVWYSVVASSILMSFLSWYYNVYIVTDERIVDVDFYNLTVKQIASAPMEHIQDVTIQTGGIIRTIFDFAYIRIQTAGTRPYITFEDVPHPDEVARKILAIAESNRNEQGGGASEL